MRTGANIITVDEMMMIHPDIFHDDIAFNSSRPSGLLDEKIEYNAVLGGDTVQILTDCPICSISAPTSTSSFKMPHFYNLILLRADLKQGTHCNLQRGDSFKFCYLKDCGQADAPQTDLSGKEKDRPPAKEGTRFGVRDSLYK